MADIDHPTPTDPPQHKAGMKGPMMYAIVMDRAKAVFSVRLAENVEPSHLNLVRTFATLTALVEAAIEMSQQGWTLLPNVEAR